MKPPARKQPLMQICGAKKPTPAPVTGAAELNRKKKRNTQQTNDDDDDDCGRTVFLRDGRERRQIARGNAIDKATDILDANRAAERNARAIRQRARACAYARTHETGVTMSRATSASGKRTASLAGMRSVCARAYVSVCMCVCSCALSHLMVEIDTPSCAARRRSRTTRDAVSDARRHQRRAHLAELGALGLRALPTPLRKHS